MRKINKFVIGIDGGGTKTMAALAGLDAKILKKVKAGPSSPRNVGPKSAAQNINQTIKKLLKNNHVAKVVIGLASIQEQPKYRQQIKKEILKDKQIAKALDNKITIVSDQLIAFYSGTDKKDGVLLISGTGCVAHGWRQKKEAHTSGWGWLADEGSAFWVGQQAFQAVLKDLDNRGPKTKITSLALKELKTNSAEGLINKVYANPMTMAPLFSVFADIASQKNDKIAQELMKRAGQELALAAKTVIKKLSFEKENFPLVLIGSMFKSPIVLNTVKKEVRRFAEKTEFIRPQQEPVMGAVKLALKMINK